MTYYLSPSYMGGRVKVLPMIGGKMAEEKQAEKSNPLESRVRDLEAALAASRAALPTSLIPEHGAGYGDEVAQTWSLAEQEEARAEE